MQQFDSSSGGTGDGPTGRGGCNPRFALVTFAFCTFVLGGFAFGWLFLVNFKLLNTVQQARINLIAGPAISIPSLPGSSAPQITARDKDGNRVVVPPIIADPVGAMIPEPAAQADAPITDLPEWTRTKRVNILLLGIDHRD